jgi:hypothetical protein
MSIAASTQAQDIVDHIFGHLLPKIRTERSALGLPAEFDLLFLLQAHAAPAEITAQIIQHFKAGEPLASLTELLPAPGPKPPPAGKTVALVQHQEPLRQLLEAHYARGEHDTNFVDYHRPDATLLHIHNVHGKP